MLAGLVTLGVSTLEQAVPEGRHPMGGTHAGAVCEELQPMGRTHMERLMEDCVPWEGPQAGAGQSVRTLPLRGKEQQRQRVMD